MEINPKKNRFNKKTVLIEDFALLLYPKRPLLTFTENGLYREFFANRGNNRKKMFFVRKHHQNHCI